MVLFCIEFGNNRIVTNKWVDERNKPPKKGIYNNMELKIIVKPDYIHIIGP